MLRKKLIAMFGAIVAASMLLSACITFPTPERIIETVVVEKTVETVVEKVVEIFVEKTREPAPDGLKTLVVCQSQEPDTLYWYGGDMLAARHILHAVYDGPIDNRTYGYQAVILEKLPSTFLW